MKPIAIALSLLMLGCTTPLDPAKRSGNTLDGVVSMIRVIAHPERYDSKTIFLGGYLHIEFESDTLYLDENHFTHGLSKDAVWFTYPPEISDYVRSLSDKYVYAYGKFTGTAPQGFGLCSGSLEIQGTNDLWESLPRERRFK